MPDETESPTVPIVCRECETRARIPVEAVADAVERHNRTVHDGDEVAAVDPAIREHIAEAAARDLGLLE